MHEDAYATLLQRATDAAAVAAQHAAWGEVHGRLHEDVVAALVAAGIPRLFLPATLGGYEVPPTVCAQVTEILAAGDASAAWYVMVFNSAKMLAARWPEAMVENLWGAHPDALVAASGHTPLLGVPCDGGFLVNGRTRFVSGCLHADYILAPLQVADQVHTVVIPAAQCQVVGAWDTLGMRASGSHDVQVTDVKVDAPWVAPTVSEFNRHYQGPLYRCPSRVVFATYVPVALSLAEQALGALTDLAVQKVPYASGAKLAQRSLAQVHYGRALAEYRAARGYFFAALEEVWQRARAGETFDARARADLYLAGTHAMQASSGVVRQVLDAAGSTAFDKASPLEKIMRDVETLRHHGFANESRYGSVAQVHWDVELDYPLLLR